MYSHTLVALTLCAPLAAQATPQVPDAWSDLVTLRAADGWYAAPIHATLMPDGTVVFMGYERELEDPTVVSETRKAAFSLAPTPLWVPPPPERTVLDRVEPVDANAFVFPPYFVDDTLFCSGHTLTSEGELFTVGGTRGVIDFVTGDLYAFGLSYATLFDGSSWSRVPADMLAVGGLGTPARWYPTVSRLPDGRLFTISGLDIIAPFQSNNLSAEVFDPASGAWTIFSDVGETPTEVYNSDYTHTVVLPRQTDGNDLLMFGHQGIPVLASLGGPDKWSACSNPRPGTLPGEIPNHGVTTAPLPIRVTDGEWGYSNGSALLAGGAHGTSHMQHVDVFDPVQETWLPRTDMGVMRHHPTSVLLPDGRVLVVTGHNKNGTQGLRHATYVDPRNGFDVALGASFTSEIRGYHNVSLLLPDGRVLVAGGQDINTGEQAEKTNFRYYYPSYLFAGRRPRIIDAPEELQFGTSYVVRSKGRAPAEVVLMGLGSVTHSFDANQRYVELATVGQVTLPFGLGHLTEIVAPSDPRVAPPGYYMLFVLDRRGVPSVARIVRVE